MNKLLLTFGASLLLLTGCGESSDKIEETNVDKETQEQSSTGDVSNKETVFASSYLKKINELIDTHGILTEDDKLGGNEGLAYVDLLDFNNDGTEELYVVYEISGVTENGFPLYKEGIWTEQSEEPHSLMTKDHGDFGVLSEGSMYVNITPDGQAFLNESGQLTEGSNTTTFDIFYGHDGFTIEELAKAEKQESYSGNSGELGYLYTITEGEVSKTVSEEEYIEFLNKYGKANSKKIINSDQGYKSLAIDLTNNEQKINDFIKKLEESIQ
ncbi:hypothetical protein [Robertmurraya sp. FSL R5-0851]|uniref:hypothetical protein n=1 Tax=Robertmurraya sp. FSL R5-0851 TaxID=2921584 RepID=UPI0030F6505E